MFHDDDRSADKTNPIPRRTTRPLTYRQLAAVRLIVRGRGSLEVARELGVEHHSVARWKRNPAFRAELERLRTLKTAAAALRAPATAPRPVPRPARPTVARSTTGTPGLRMPRMASVALAPGNPLHLTKEELEQEAMIEAHLRAHGM